MQDTPHLYGLAHWMRYALEHAGDLKKPYQELVQAAENDPMNAAALLDMSTIMLMSHQDKIGLDLQATALAQQTLYTVAPPPNSQLSILVLMYPGALMQNTPIDCLLEGAPITLHFLYIAPHLALPTELPEHDLLFVAIGQSSHSLETLQQLQPILAEWERPVVNMPQAISQLTREATFAQLHDIPNVVVPYTFLTSRTELTTLLAEEDGLSKAHPTLRFPMIIRPRDSHAGERLALVHSKAQIHGYLRSLLHQEFYVSNYIDYQDAQGQFIKYRIVFIDGHPLVCHVAMNDHWIIHYANAGMDTNPEKRALEAKLMQNFATDFAQRHATALSAVAERLGLDYVGIDCAETPDGQLLVFEADTSIIVHNFDDPEKYAYKQPIMQKVFTAFQDLLTKKARP